MSIKNIGLAAAAIIGLFGLNSSFYTVDAGHKAIKFNRLTGLGKKIYK